MKPIFFAIIIVCLLSGAAAAWGAGDLKVLPGHVPALPAGLRPGGLLPETNQLRLAIGLPLRDERGLDLYLAQIYDPVSTNYQRYLTPEEFTKRYGPTMADYQAVVDYARGNNLTIAATHGNRLLLDVTGSVADVQRAFHVNLLVYRHPTEDRDFYAPDTEPTVANELTVADVSGLDNYRRPRPLTHIRRVAPNATGSGPSGAYQGKDFRAAYLPGTTLTGAGQMVGLVQFDGYYASDINTYAAAAGLPSVPLQNVLLDGFNGTPTTGPNSGNIEVSLDIEMVMSMAPGLSRIVVFEGGPNGLQNDILNAMAASNQVKQLSCSWGWSGGPSTTTDGIFKQMAAQGQSFFNASGDSDAFTTGLNSANGVDNPSLDNAPSSSPYITMVGGTTLTTGSGGAWASETVWNWGLYNGSYVGSSGGISSSNALPAWQSGINMTANGGSTAYRNIPDVALVADNVEVDYGNGASDTVGGTSCAAPLWAALTALINQQAASSGKASAGFLNPAIYALGKGGAYGTAFHDITTGNNTWSDSPSQFYAVSGYDLCTGWGTPGGQALINALSGAANWLGVLPGTGFTAAGPVGGAFVPDAQTLILTNAGASPITWSLINTSAWLTVSPTSGTLGGGGTVPVSASLTAAASALTPGNYGCGLLVTNPGGGVLVPFQISVGQSLIQNGGFETGDFSGWTFSGDSVIRHAIYDSVESTSSGFTVVHSGKYGAFLGDVQLASLSQSFATVPGQYYWVSFWLDNPSSGSGQQFTANWITDGTVMALVNWASPPGFSWTNLQFLVRAAGTNSGITIEAENSANYFGLDDIRITPVPAPEFAAVSPSGQNVRLSWLACTGLVYQVQYKTNLLQANWLGLNSASAATNFSGTMLDPSVSVSAASRFYRLSVAP